MIIEVDNYRIPWFGLFDITTSISSIADVATFVTRLYDELLVNKEVNILLDEDIPLFKGYLDRMSPAEYMGKWESRSTTSALIDSCPIVSTGEFKNRTTIQIIEALAAPFGIEVVGEEGILFSKYNVELDATCDSIISELCIYSGLVASTTPEGKLMLDRYSPDVNYPSETILGIDNCNMSLIVDSRRMAREYQVLGQDSFLDGDKTGLVATEDGVFPGIKRACFISDSTTNAVFIKQQAEWMRRGFDASGEQLKVTIPGIRTLNKGSFVTVNNPSFKIENGKRLIETVRYVQEQDKSPHTELTLVNPSKYGGKVEPMSGWLL